jgi:hypothetical protein
MKRIVIALLLTGSLLADLSARDRNAQKRSHAGEVAVEEEFIGGAEDPVAADLTPESTARKGFRRKRVKVEPKVEPAVLHAAEVKDQPLEVEAQAAPVVDPAVVGITPDLLFDAVRAEDGAEVERILAARPEYLNKDQVDDANRTILYFVLFPQQGTQMSVNAQRIAAMIIHRLNNVVDEGRPSVVREYLRVRSISGCHALHIAAGYANRGIMERLLYLVARVFTREQRKAFFEVKDTTLNGTFLHHLVIFSVYDSLQKARDILQAIKQCAGDDATDQTALLNEFLMLTDGRGKIACEDSILDVDLKKLLTPTVMQEEVQARAAEKPGRCVVS